MGRDVSGPGLDIGIWRRPLMASIFTVKYRVGSVNENKQKVGGMVRQLKENGGLKK